MHVARRRPFTGWWWSDSSRGDDARDLARFETLFTRHYPLVYRILYSLLQSREGAEDMAQEVFLRFHRQTSLLRARDDGEPARWLARVATNVGLNELRGRRRQAARERAETALRAPDALAGERAADPAIQVTQREGAALVEETLAGMAERARACLVLRHSGLSYGEIASALDLAPGSVGTVLARAEREFRRRYLAAGGADDTGQPTRTLD